MPLPGFLPPTLLALANTQRDRYGTVSRRLEKSASLEWGLSATERIAP